MSNRFNLVDEPWLPVVDHGRVSLKMLFSQSEYRALGGTPTEKMALLKLLLAIAQAACTPDNDYQWQQLGWQGLAQRCLDYLQQQHDRFWLYGEQPFLQLPAIAAATVQSYGAVLPQVSTGNTTVLTESQQQKQLDDGEKAVLLVTLMGFALGGKKTDNSVVLSPGYQGKSNARGKAASGRTGPAMAHMGLLHSVCLGETLLQTLWLNLLSHEQITQCGLFPEGVGTAPWQQMPEGEDCVTARRLKQTLMGRLVPLSRFCLLQDSGLHYSEGLAHDSHNEGRFDPTIAIDRRAKKPKVLWANPEKRPWRELPALLSFIGQQQATFHCLQLDYSLTRAAHQPQPFAVWSGGLRVSANAGEQYASGTDDCVESMVWLEPSQFGEPWFNQLCLEMTALEQLAKMLYACVSRYCRELKIEKSEHPAQACGLFWQLCERQYQALVHDCEDREKCAALRRRFVGYLQQSFDQYCPHHSVRQLEAWAASKPKPGRYLKQES